MRIVHIISHLGCGGAEKMLFDEIRSCTTRDHEHIVLYIKPGIFIEKIEALRIPTYQLSGMIFRYDPFIYYRLKQLLQTLAPDVIHASLWAANVLARFAGRALKIPVINDIHGDVGHSGRFRLIIDRLTLFPETSFVAVSTSVKESVLRFLPAVKENAITVIPNGVDAQLITAQGGDNQVERSLLGLSSDRFIIGSVGRLHVIKGYDLLMKSFALFKAMVHEKRPHPSKAPLLLLVGDGPDYGRLQALAKELGIEEDLVFAGYQDNVYRWYPLFDCFVLPSHSEGLSLSLLEAMSFGIPSITTHNDHGHDVMVHNEHGLLVAKNNQQELSAALLALYKEPERAHLLGKNGARLVAHSFRLGDMVRKYDKLYQQVVST